VQTLCIFALGQGLATSSRQIPQGRNAARVVGCSGAISVLALFFLLVGKLNSRIHCDSEKVFKFAALPPLKSATTSGPTRTQSVRVSFL
jgi:hypothetical protein